MKSKIVIRYKSTGKVYQEYVCADSKMANRLFALLGKNPTTYYTLEMIEWTHEILDTTPRA